MSKHRPRDEPPAVGEPPADDAPTRIDPSAEVPADADLSQLARRAADHLQAAAVAADDVPRRAAEVAVALAITEAVKVVKRGYRRILLGALTVVLAAMAIGSIVGYHYFTGVATQVAELKAGDAYSSDVGEARQTNLQTARRHLTEVNTARVKAGLVAVPDPGLNASSGEVDGAWTVGLSELATLGDLEARGQAVPGVTAPAPGGGAFPWITARPDPGN